MFLAFGITFEVPVAVVLLVRMNIVTIKQLSDARGYVIVGAFVIAAVVTPPDVVSQFLLAVPLCILYEVGLLVARGIKPRKEEEKTTTPESTS
jgi:sec-independent protein translocase protein TatC